MLTRREMLQRAAGAAALSTLSPVVRAADAKKVPVIDTHLHCFARRDDARFPYHAQAPYRPDAATPEHLLRCMDGAGVDYAVVVHPEPYQDDHRYLEHCLRVGNGRLKGTCLFFAGRDGLAAQMTALVKKGGIVTARIHAYAPERLPPFGKPELRELWRLAGDLGLAVQLHFEPRYAEGFEPLIKEFRDTIVIIDHLGRPFQGKPEEHAAVVRWSRFPNTIMKLSAIPKERNYPHRAIEPILKSLSDAFGGERLIYGGGFDDKATPESYRAERERTRSYIAHLPPADQAKVLGGNAARLFRFA